MKTINKVCRIAALVFGVLALVLFFTHFATITADQTTYTLAGSELAFKGKVAEIGQKMARSTDLWFCFWVSVISVVCSVFTFLNKKGARFAQPAFAAVSGIYMLVVALSPATKFVDCRPISTTAKVTTVAYAQYTFLPTVALVCIALLLAVAFGVAHLLLQDKLDAEAAKDLTIIKKVVRFLRDYKSETKKIVWPTFKDVVKNTVIVLVLCLFIGVFIWLIDWGLGELLALILKI